MNLNTSKASVQWLLTNDVAFLEWAIAKLWSLQTTEEQRYGQTFVSNRQGFNFADGKGDGKYLGTWLASGKHLSGRFIEKGRNMMWKYAGQLSLILQAAERQAMIQAQDPSTWRDEVKEAEPFQLNTGVVEHNIPDLFLSNKV